MYFWVIGQLVGEFVFPLVPSQMFCNEHGVFQNLVSPPCISLLWPRKAEDGVGLRVIWHPDISSLTKLFNV